MLGFDGAFVKRGDMLPRVPVAHGSNAVLIEPHLLGNSPVAKGVRNIQAANFSHLIFAQLCFVVLFTLALKVLAPSALMGVQHVFGCCPENKMFWIDTHPAVTCVHDKFAERNWLAAICDPPRCNMGIYLSVANLEGTVTVPLNGTSPNHAAR